MSRGVAVDPESTRQKQQRDTLYYKARFYSIFLCFLAFFLGFYRSRCRVVAVVYLDMSTLRSGVKGACARKNKEGPWRGPKQAPWVFMGVNMCEMSYEPKPRLRPPEWFVLPDGRRFRTAELMNRVTNRQSYNLRTGTVRPLYGCCRRRST